MKKPEISNKKFLPGVLRALYNFLPVAIFGIYPVIFLYSKNAEIVLFSSLWHILLLYLVAIVVIYLTSMFLCKAAPIKAATASIVFIFFLNTYGLFYRFLLEEDIVMVKHYIFLPLCILTGVYSAWLITKLRKKDARTLLKAIMYIFLALTTLNIIHVIPTEIDKLNMAKAKSTIESNEPVSTNNDFPDIYYLVFDEFSGLHAMEDFFQTPEVTGFREFLQEQGFYVIENSHSNSTETRRETASRLNYFVIPQDADTKYLITRINKNNAVRFLQSKGYTIVVFEELSWLHPSIQFADTDYLVEVNTRATGDLNLLFDEFGMLVADNTILHAFSNFNRQRYTPHINMLKTTLEQIPQLDDISSPKFVFSHLMIPHAPFLYDRNGNLLDAQNFSNYDYYEAYWIYSTKYIEQMVTGILENSDPEHPPVIILQSDHGARIRQEKYNFPADYSTDILFAMYLPGFDTAVLRQDENPINTLPIVFNHYLGENIPLE